MGQDRIEIDGSQGEGGGQVLRTSLALSLITGVPVRFTRIRARRPKPGLRAQHLTCVEAARAVGRAEVTGAALGARELTFHPGEVTAGDYAFDLGTAGSTSLVLQTVLPALVRGAGPRAARGPSTVRLRGGTHNPLAPPFEFLERVYLPLLARMGPRVTATLERPGFYPKGGGRVRFEIEPARLRPLELLERGALRACRARALVSSLPERVARAELDVVGRELGWEGDALAVVEVEGKGPGNALLCEVEAEHARELFAAFGERGRPAEAVALAAVQEVREYLALDVPVGPHLADQLLLLCALAGGGRFRTGALTGHTRTQVEVIERFLPLSVARRDLGAGVFELEVLPRD